MDQQETEGQVPGPFFYYVRDWTVDLDSPYEYERFQIEVVNYPGRLEER